MTFWRLGCLLLVLLVGLIGASILVTRTPVGAAACAGLARLSVGPSVHVTCVVS